MRIQQIEDPEINTNLTILRFRNVAVQVVLTSRERRKEDVVDELTTIQNEPRETGTT